MLSWKKYAPKFRADPVKPISTDSLVLGLLYYSPVNYIPSEPEKIIQTITAIKREQKIYSRLLAKIKLNNGAEQQIKESLEMKLKKRLLDGPIELTASLEGAKNSEESANFLAPANSEAIPCYHISVIYRNERFKYQFMADFKKGYDPYTLAALESLVSRFYALQPELDVKTKV